MSRASERELRERVADLEARAAEASALASQVASLQREIRLLHYEGDHERFDEVEESLRAAEELVDSGLPAGEPVGVLGAGADAMLSLPGRVVTPLEPGGSGEPPAAGAGRLVTSMALIESARAAGLRNLLVSGPQLGGDELGPRLRDYLDASFELVAENPAVGALYRVEALREPGLPSTVGTALDVALGGDRFVPVLDWTHLGLSARMPDRMIFTPPGSADVLLPYADDSIVAVVIDDPARADEARRIASVATIGARQEPDGRLVAVDVDAFGGTPALASFEVLVDASAGDAWFERISAALTRKRRTVVRAVERPLAAAADSDAEVAIIAEPGVMPLPGCLDALGVALNRGDAVAAAAPKLVAADGSLAAAGAMVFGDGTVAGIGAGTADTAAPWHEFARPVPAATGLLALRPDRVPDTAESAGLTAIAAEVWRSGLEVRYQPDAWAVRAIGAEPAEGTGAPGWEPALERRPHRPLRLDRAAWRSLLARDDVAESWR